jgi:hypothetical protein
MPSLCETNESITIATVQKPGVMSEMLADDDIE